MQKQEEKKQIYELVLIKYEVQQSIILLSTDSYDVAFEKWQEITDLWTKCVQDKVPMKITTPVVTAFDPAAIREISVRPVMEAPVSKYDNPYQQNMMRKGLTQSLKDSGNTGPVHPDILDGGYS